MAIKITAAAAGSMATALATAIGSGAIIEIRSGAAPATPETAASGTLLVSIPLTGSFSATGNVLTAADPAAVSPTAAGTAAHFRLKTSGGTAIMDGTVGTSGADMNLGSTTITMGVQVDLGVPTITVPVS